MKFHQIKNDVVKPGIHMATVMTKTTKIMNPVTENSCEYHVNFRPYIENSMVYFKNVFMSIHISL